MSPPQGSIRRGRWVAGAGTPFSGFEESRRVDTIASVMRRLLGPSDGSQELVDLTLDALDALYASPPSWLRANFVATLDGAVELDGVSGGLGAPADREVFVALRAQADAVMVGASTARAENYGPAWLRADARARRTTRGQAALPSVVLVTASGHIDPSSRLFTEHRDDQPDPPPVLVVTCEKAGAEGIDDLRRSATVLVCGDDEVDLVGARVALAERGLARIVCEGGPTLLGSLLGAGVLDELCLTHSPMLAGPGHPTLLGVGLDPAQAPARFELTGLAEADGMLFARYRPTGEQPA